MNNRIIADRLRQARGNKTVAEVAKSIDISRSALAMYENGHRVPKDDIKKKLANYYKTSVEALFF